VNAQVSNKSTEEQIHAALDSAYRNKTPLGTLWSLFQNYHPRMVLVVLTFAIKQSPVWALPIVTGNIITAITHVDNARRNGHAVPSGPLVSFMIVNAVIMFVLIAQNIPMHTLYARLLSSVVRQVQLVLRSALVVRLQQLSMSFHDNMLAGRLQSKVLRDVEAVQQLSSLLIDTLLSGLLILVAAFVVTLAKSPVTLLFFLITVPAAVALTRLFGGVIRERNEAFRVELEKMSGEVSEMIEMIPVARAHAVEQSEVARLNRRLVRIRRAGQELDTTSNLFGSSGWATFQAFQMLCLVFNVWQCYRGWITVGDVVMYQGFFAMVVGSVQSMVATIPQLALGIESIRSIGEVLESPDLERNDGKLAVQAVRGHIEFQAVSYQYPGADRLAVENFSLDVRSGETIAVVGQSGSGKSTLMNLIIGFRRPTAGKILVDGVDMEAINLQTLRRFLAVVPQRVVLFSGTVRENIAYGLEQVTDEHLNTVLELANCTEFIREMPKGLDTPLGNRGGKLSGGQRQRIAIARAMLRDPHIIILDEATSALDLASEHLVQQAINRLIKGRTTFIVAHRLSTVRHADRIVVMDHGKLAEVGPSAELLAQSNSAFARLHALQA
jgi:ATP-binding cassette subfamily B protein